jgi:hypothetical protein
MASDQNTDELFARYVLFLCFSILFRAAKVVRRFFKAQEISVYHTLSRSSFSKPLSNLFGSLSLGGSLMKDLWADLQIGEGSGQDDDMGWSLEQLEKELTAHLGDEQPAVPADGALDPTLLSAASLVVSSQQEQAHLQQPYKAPVATSSAADAWSQSLEKFTALSLEQDFLAADSARKGTTTTTAMPDPSILTAAEEYNVAEAPQLASPPAGWTAPARPPGMPSPSPKTKRTVAARPQNSMPALPEMPPTRTLPKTPQNSIATDEDDRSSPIVTAPSVDLPKGQVQQQPPPPAAAWQQVPPVAIPAWKGPPPPQLAPPAATMSMPTPAAPVFCQSHPFAPPIPATALESSLMKARDISYVLHSMLKPVLIAGTSRNDYDIMLLQKRQGQQVSKDRKKTGYSMEKEMASRQEKSKEWHEKHGTLGHVAKADVSRPRALLATPTLKKKEQDESSKERAALWKARVYVDQCYQAYHSVVECWQAAPPGTVPKAVQPHLLKLLKCLGIKKLASSAGSYEVASHDALGYLLKLPKGQTLLARILEQALLPPNAVQALMPALLQVALSNPKQQPQSPADMRLFRALRSVVSGLPNIQGSCLLACVGKVKEAGATQALASAARMECVHALLRRGQVLSQQGSDASFQEEWTKTEEEFMSMLG